MNYTQKAKLESALTVELTLTIKGEDTWLTAPNGSTVVYGVDRRRGGKDYWVVCTAKGKVETFDLTDHAGIAKIVTA